jgi:hypothetical protein
MIERGYWILKPDHSVEKTDMMTWARQFESTDRQVDLTEIAPGIRVSTVFLGLDHNFSGHGPPLLFETMVFDDYGGGEMLRYATWNEAKAGHDKMVSELKAKMRKEGAIFPH